ncbi:uncharacterized protein EDB93DRAFT_1107466 [Suillus bovinus]|uniref:uncharacterized protein n=1 Tax=Suillus bovinus TaxID=48563 RepID=UPI001B85D005|nr:uncharacterized protein EDB93DRAFT_1107466 [Suillus bovinus]KAG2133815.1 hypothetical protein EDB93DRAFT_1107466 [Suillus bovinus]
MTGRDKFCLNHDELKTKGYFHELKSKSSSYRSLHPKSTSAFHNLARTMRFSSLTVIVALTSIIQKERVAPTPVTAAIKRMTAFSSRLVLKSAGLRVSQKERVATRAATAAIKMTPAFSSRLVLKSAITLPLKEAINFRVATHCSPVIEIKIEATPHSELII